MKDKINLLFYKDIGTFLKGEELKYIVCPIENGIVITHLPHTINERISSIKDYFAYDYDELCPLNQDLYEEEYKPVIRNPNGSYDYDTKKYNLKRNHKQ